MIPPLHSPNPKFFKVFNVHVKRKKIEQFWMIFENQNKCLKLDNDENETSNSHDW